MAFSAADITPCQLLPNRVLTVCRLLRYIYYITLKMDFQAFRSKLDKCQGDFVIMHKCGSSEIVQFLQFGTRVKPLNVVVGASHVFCLNSVFLIVEKQKKR